MKTDWEEIREGYNRKFKTNCITVEAMFKDLLDKDKSCSDIAKILGFDKKTIIKKMTALGVRSISNLETTTDTPRHSRHSKVYHKLLRISPEELKEMTLKEISYVVGHSFEYTRKVLRRMNFNYKGRKV